MGWPMALGLLALLATLILLAWIWRRQSCRPFPPHRDEYPHELGDGS